MIIYILTAMIALLIISNLWFYLKWLKAIEFILDIQIKILEVTEND